MCDCEVIEPSDHSCGTRAWDTIPSTDNYVEAADILVVNAGVVDEETSLGSDCASISQARGFVMIVDGRSINGDGWWCYSVRFRPDYRGTFGADLFCCCDGAETALFSLFVAIGVAVSTVGTILCRCKEREGRVLIFNSASTPFFVK